MNIIWEIVRHCRILVNGYLCIMKMRKMRENEGK